MSLVSIVIPSRQPEFLQKTVDDILKHARGEIEIIVVFDGIWPETMLRDDKRVKIIHHGTVHNSAGMREGINMGVAISQGDYIMKTDEHCMFDRGFDVKLIEDCEDNWVVIPRRYRLDADNWKLIKDGRPPVDYMFISYPYERPNDPTCGLHGDKWDSKHFDLLDTLIDDTPTMQGSCYFMPRKHWDTTIKFLDSSKYGTFTQEAQEISMATWLSGGRVIVNKKTWYAHLHKGKRGKGYGFSNAQYDHHQKWKEIGRLYCIDYWTSTKDYKYDFDWFINEKFPDMPGWGTDWRERMIADKAKEV